MHNDHDAPTPTPLDTLSETLADRAAAPHDAAIAELQAAAERWAVYCLRTHTDDLLTLGLQISIACAQYVTAVQAQA